MFLQELPYVYPLNGFQCLQFAAIPGAAKYAVMPYAHKAMGASKSNLQRGLIRQMKNFILELGKDFLFLVEEYSCKLKTAL